LLSGEKVDRGSFAAAPGGLDTLVFAGDIGGNAPLASRLAVRVIRMDEELMMARPVARL
jgi:acetate kinase